ncbi:Uncharacterised protein [Xylophilus ampelinus]|nr:Uncharacterised protein [Xylophilus ampelinus]
MPVWNSPLMRTPARAIHPPSVFWCTVAPTMPVSSRLRRWCTSCSCGSIVQFGAMAKAWPTSTEASRLSPLPLLEKARAGLTV